MKRLLAGLGVVIIGVAGGWFWWQVSLSPVDIANKKTVTFTVKKGEGIREIAKNLKSTGLIRDPVAFFLLERFFISAPPQAGVFQLSPSMSATEIAQKLTLGTEDVWITIPEGWRSEQILERLVKELASGQATLEQKEMGAWKSEEGRYFPDTYRLPKGASLEEVRQLMLRNFQNRVPQITREQLIIASLVEREAKGSFDRPLIAGVIFNRLKIGMKLDIDATVQYALGKTKNGEWWKKDLTLEDLKTPSAYNTYLNPGLPPTPICNPGLAAIEAAINPATTDYLYYLHDKAGNAYFARTLAEHQENIARYLQK